MKHFVALSTIAVLLAACTPPAPEPEPTQEIVPLSITPTE